MMVLVKQLLPPNNEGMPYKHRDLVNHHLWIGTLEMEMNHRIADGILFYEHRKSQHGTEKWIVSFLIQVQYLFSE